MNARGGVYGIMSAGDFDGLAGGWQIDSNGHDMPNAHEFCFCDNFRFPFQQLRVIQVGMRIEKLHLQGPTTDGQLGQGGRGVDAKNTVFSTWCV
jgi:hypothetical protein